MSKKVIVAMSGGVDSSVAAYLLIKEGYSCTGATMRLYEQEGSESNSIRDAKNVAQRLGMDYYVFDFRNEFKEKVIENFVKTYEAGGTPNPCIVCNRYLKFKMMLDEAEKLFADYVATGHYARISCENGWYYLKKAADCDKDQSYVLYSLTQHQLKHTLFPLGEYTKSQIREIASEQGFLNANKKDSQDICFVPDGDYASFIESYRGKVCPSGDFIDKDGNVLGRHNGIIRYTVGQRKGLGIAFGKPVYVVDKLADKNAVVLGDNDELFTRELIASDFNWLIPDPDSEIKCLAKVRYNMKEQPATAYKISADKVKIVFDVSQRAVTKGQSAVLYIGDTVIGGGIID